MPFISGSRWLAIWITASLLCLAGAACSTRWPSPPQVSSIDSNYRLSKLESAYKPGAGDSPGVRAYRNLLSRTLGSHCRYFPSDSRYHLTLSKKCGPGRATIKSMSRFLLEYDAPQLGHPFVFEAGTLHYEDLPDDCNWI